MIRRRFCLIAAIAAFAASTPLQAQQPKPAAPARDTAAPAVPDTTTHGVRPRTAFIRSLIVPGWGQMSVHAYTRGAVFIGLQGASWYMLVKTLKKLSQAQDRADARTTAANAIYTDTLHAQMSRDTSLNRRLSDPDSFRIHLSAAVAADSALKATRSLVNSREQQRQDWITYVLFTTLASGVDAYVAAHLADFPAAITTRREPNGAYQFKVTVPVPRKP